MKVLVAGRLGQVAQALLRALPPDGHEVVALEPPELDLTSRESIAAAVAAAKPDLVVNAAAYTAVDKAESDAALAYAVNRDGAGWLAAEAAAIGVPFVHFSTDYVFPGEQGAPYRETDPTSPLGVYGASKLEGEQAVLAANPRSVILRTAWVCSPDGHNFVRTMLRLAATRDEVGVVADQHGAPTFAADLAAAVRAMAPALVAAPAGDARFGVFHLTGMPHTTWHGFAEAIFAGAAARGHKVPRLKAIATADYPTPARRPADGRLDCAKLAAVHGFAAPDWRLALSDTLDTLIGPTLTAAAPQETK
ncbi:dTDP-4-dehydrorhamnose reductase [Roseomonas sp. GC11]|uniref:dTDP-4-dehydrorhamnose reductase n=1 Tax=Roseomonas sp. GC11 TaxID=2950546 RepID=UPI00210882DD|nr:dTDP-4-dehydrorhamnose reductase [Roseomonas sp. GC11]MCQ4161237.1 dTDP-4-dehydrorhamnose reductase [Roseomonas sp. GC11]